MECRWIPFLNDWCDESDAEQLFAQHGDALARDPKATACRERNPQYSARTDVGLANQSRVTSELARPEVAYHPPEPRDAWLERRGWGVCLRLRAAGDGWLQVRWRRSAYRRPVAGACSKNLFLPFAIFGLDADCAALCGKGQRAGGQLPRLVRCHHPCTCEHSDRPLTHGDGCAQEDWRVRCIPDRFARLR